MLFRQSLATQVPDGLHLLLVFSLQKTLLFFRVSTKFYKITVDTYMILVLEPKGEPVHCERKDASEVLIGPLAVYLSSKQLQQLLD